MPTSPTFSAEEALAAQRFLREALGLGPEAFSVPAFLGMLSDEIGRLLSAGRSPEEISALIAKATGKTVAPGAITATRGRDEGKRPEELNAANDG